jgi:geranylgeranyl pyrophosphate synthase
VNASVSRVRRSSRLTNSLGLGDKFFSTAEERRVADSVERGLDTVEARLISDMEFADDLADVTSRYLLDAGGKRVRPTLTLLTAQLGDGINDNVVTAASALEITHLASLYHDDVIDLTSEADTTGKTPGTDLRGGVATLPVLYLRELAATDADAAHLYERVRPEVASTHDSDDPEFIRAIAELREHPVTRRTLDEAHRWADEAVAALAVVPAGPVKKALTRFAESIIERSS